MNSQNSRVINVVLAGVGGQGILLASEILARAAMLAGYMVKTNEVHGMAQRGGSVIAQIRYGVKVLSPLVAAGTADVLAALEKIEALRYAHYLSPSGFAVVSSDEMVPITVSSGNAIYPKEAEILLKQAFPRVACIDATGEAVGLGAARSANTVVMGAISTELSLPVEFWQESIRATVKPKYVDINLKAFDAGRNLILKKKT